MSYLIEDFREVATAVVLNQYGGHDDANIVNGDPVCEIVQRDPQFQPKILLLIALAEFAAYRLGRFFSHHAHSRRETVPGSNGRVHQIQSFRQILPHTVKPAGAPPEDV